MRLPAIGLVAMLALGALGCGGGVGEVSGTVQYAGKPLAMGFVGLMPKEGGVPLQTEIQPDGSYRLAEVPSGEYQVFVFSPEPPPAPVAAAHSDSPEAKKIAISRAASAPPTAAPASNNASKWVRIPDFYGRPTESLLTLTVKSGANKNDISLAAP